jgi:hypothetical protein
LISIFVLDPSGLPASKLLPIDPLVILTCVFEPIDELLGIFGGTLMIVVNCPQAPNGNSAHTNHAATTNTPPAQHR